MSEPLETIKKHWNKGNYGENIPFIALGLVSGIVCCLYAMLFTYIEGVSLRIIETSPVFLFALSPFLMAFAVWVVRRHAPGATGSGIPQVIVCLDKKYGSLANSYLSLRSAAVKIASSAAALFAGAAIGREGPSLQISAALGVAASRWAEKAHIKIKTEQLIIAGAASGLAAAFNTPIGGIVYAVEELALDHIRSYKTVLLMSVLIAGFTAQLILGNYLYLGDPSLASGTGARVLFIVGVVGVVSGWLGSLFSTLLLKLIAWRKKLPAKLQYTLAGGVALIMTGFFYYHGSHALFSGKESIRQALFTTEHAEFEEFVFRFLSPLLSSMTGLAGGIFAPSLSAGATFGAFVADWTDPALRTLLSLAGMIGFLTGVTRTPITSFVLVLEMTDRHSAVFPMMLAAVFSSLGAHLLGDHSFYETSAEIMKGEIDAAKTKTAPET